MKQKCVIMFDHESPEETYVVLNPSQGFIEELYEDDMLYVFEEELNVGNIHFIAHDDETLDLCDTGYQRMSEIRKSMIGDAKKGLKTSGPNIYIYFKAICWEFESEGDGEYKDKITAEDVVDTTFAVLEQCVIDCDSEKAYSFIDTKRWKIVGGSDPGYRFFKSEEEFKKYIGWDGEHD